MNGVLKRAMAAWPIGLALAILLAAGPAGLAESSYNDRLPNGAVFGCDMCHDPETTFKTHFKNQGRLWTAALAAMDSDGDGSANGVELQDPSGTWQQGQANPGNPALVTNPGDGGSHPVATATPTRTPTRTPTALPPTATPTRTPTAVPPRPPRPGRRPRFPHRSPLHPRRWGPPGLGSADALVRGQHGRLAERGHGPGGALRCDRPGHDRLLAGPGAGPRPGRHDRHR